MRRRLVPLAVVAALVPLAVPAVAASRSSSTHIWVEIRRTEHGTPHILAHDWRSLGYGYGYAFAQDNLCTMANDYVTVDAQRSRYFGPSASYTQYGNGVTVTNLDSDVFFQQIISSGIIDRLLQQAPPDGPKPGVRQLVAGYAAGYNRYLHDVGGAAGVPDPRCRGQAWVRPITQATVWRRFYQLVLLAGYDVAIPGIAEAAPPPPGAAPLGLPRQPAVTAAALAAGWHREMGGLGSNAVAVGAAGTRDHRHGLLLGNPHFPWQGPERFYQAQLTIPGVIDVSGASLYGVPLVLIGHTASMAWSHTVSTAFRFTPYQLTLVPGQPTTYLVDGTPEPMQARPVSVLVRQPNGSLGRVTHTLWWTRYGPVFNNLVGVPLPWTPVTAFAMRDANVTNFRVFNHFFDTDQASSTLQELAILKKYQGIPWVNTIVSDRGGVALYADIGAIPNVPNSLAQVCDTALGAATFADLGLPVLDGSRSSCAWRTDPDAAAPGIFGPTHEPYLIRDDYVTNSNDSYWLANPHQPLVGFARIIGTENTARTLRTRSGLVMVAARIAGSDRLGPAGFTHQDMQRLVFSDYSYAAQITRGDLVSMCQQMAALGYAPTDSGAPVPVGNACTVLAHWDLRDALASRGALLFRQFWSYASSAEPSPFSHAYSSSDPVHTPYGLDTTNPQVRIAFGDALRDLEQAHIPFDAPLGKVQGIVRRGVRIPLHGGTGDPEGVFDAIWFGWSPGHGVVAPNGGSSYVQVVTWHAGACPDAATILTYGESENPTSPYFADQTRLFSASRWVPDRFCAAQIAADPDLHTLVLTA